MATRRQRMMSFDAQRAKDHSGPCWPSDPCARCMGYPENEILALEVSRARESSRAPSYVRVRVERGHCFFNAAKFAARNRAWSIVHGIPLGRGPIEGERYAHAWNEVTYNGVRWCYDAALDLLMPAEVFYLMGAIEYTVRYSFEEVARLVEQTEHAGPWDEKINSAK